jgi:uncharacterized protein with FMN-binding domain
MSLQPTCLCLLAAGLLTAAVPQNLVSAEPAPKRSFQQAIDQLQIPPAWFATTPVNWDTNKPWKDARLEIRRLLALDDARVREAVKLTWVYGQKGDIGDGHELPMYLFMSGNYAWAAVEYPKYLEQVAGKGPTHAYLCYASCLAHFGENQRALDVLDKAMRDLPPKPWRINNTANIHNHYGDLYAKAGNLVKAREHYAEAMRLYPTSDQPYGRHLLHRYVAKIQNKLDLLKMQSLQNTSLRDGAYLGKAMGYSDKKDLEVTVIVRDGKIANVKVAHEEKIDLNATTIIPKRIVEKQSLQVDGITGATITCQGIVDGAFQALKQAGLK